MSDEPKSPAEAVAFFMNTMSKGQYLIFRQAIQQLGGELRIDWAAIQEAAGQPAEIFHIDDTDGPVVVRLAGSE